MCRNREMLQISKRRRPRYSAEEKKVIAKRKAKRRRDEETKYFSTIDKQLRSSQSPFMDVHEKMVLSLTLRLANVWKISHFVLHKWKCANQSSVEILYPKKSLLQDSSSDVFLIITYKSSEDRKSNWSSTILYASQSIQKHIHINNGHELFGAKFEDYCHIPDEGFLDLRVPTTQKEKQRSYPNVPCRIVRSQSLQFGDDDDGYQLEFFLIQPTAAKTLRPKLTGPVGTKVMGTPLKSGPTDFGKHGPQYWRAMQARRIVVQKGAPKNLTIPEQLMTASGDFPKSHFIKRFNANNTNAKSTCCASCNDDPYNKAPILCASTDYMVSPVKTNEDVNLEMSRLNLLRCQEDSQTPVSNSYSPISTVPTPGDFPFSMNNVDDETQNYDISSLDVNLIEECITTACEDLKTDPLCKENMSVESFQKREIEDWDSLEPTIGIQTTPDVLSPKMESLSLSNIEVLEDLARQGPPEAVCPCTLMSNYECAGVLGDLKIKAELEDAEYYQEQKGPNTVNYAYGSCGDTVNVFRGQPGINESDVVTFTADSHQEDITQCHQFLVYDQELVPMSKKPLMKQPLPPSPSLTRNRPSQNLLELTQENSANQMELGSSQSLTGCCSGAKFPQPSLDGPCDRNDSLTRMLISPPRFIGDSCEPQSVLPAATRRVILSQSDVDMNSTPPGSVAHDLGELTQQMSTTSISDSDPGAGR